MIASLVSEPPPPGMYQFDSHNQLLDRLEHGRTEPVHPSSIHPPVKDPTYIGKGEPQLDIISPVGHGVLDERELE